MDLELSVGSKTFLLGEYFVLQSGQALVASTDRRFRLLIQPSEKLRLAGIHPESPAGKLISENSEVFCRSHVQFIDPHKGEGGLGASTAQFAMVFEAIEQMQSVPAVSSNQKLSSLLQTYHRLAWSGEGIRPSGADLLGQYLGGLTLINTLTNDHRQLTWNFSDLQFLVVKTGKKLATHEHLKSLGAERFEQLEPAFHVSIEGLETGDSENFLSGVREYRQTLADLNLVAEHTKHLLEILDDLQITEAHKGCGAMGADTMALFVRPDRLDEAVEWSRTQGLLPLVDSEDLTLGIEYLPGKSQLGESHQ